MRFNSKKFNTPRQKFWSVLTKISDRNTQFWQKFPSGFDEQFFNSLCNCTYSLWYLFSHKIFVNIVQNLVDITCWNFQIIFFERNFCWGWVSRAKFAFQQNFHWQWKISPSSYLWRFILDRNFLTPTEFLTHDENSSHPRQKISSGCSILHQCTM